MDIQQIPQEWIDTFTDLSNRRLLKPSINYEVLFSLPALYSKPLHTLNLGTVAFPSGHIVTCDPLVAFPS